jgi:hypothetical protein
MKRLLALAFLVALPACLEAQSTAATPTTVRSYPDARYSTGVPANSPKDSPLRKWTTKQLQERRIELYRMVPQRQTRRGVPVYITHGDKLPQQEEILQIESELNRRYQAGDKSAELKRPIPGEKHL